MTHVSKKLIRLTIMDALDQVLKGRGKRPLSKNTKMMIIEAVEKITESVEQDFSDDGKIAPLALKTSTKKVAGIPSVKRKSSSNTPPR